MTPAQQITFLNTLKSTGLPLKAMEATGLPAQAIIQFIQDNPNFEQSAKHHALGYKESIIHEVHRRGVLGWDEPVYFQGKIATDFNPVTGRLEPLVIRRYDSALLQMEARRVEAGYRTGDPIVQTPLQSLHELDNNYQDDSLMRIEFVDGEPIPLEDQALFDEENSKIARVNGPPPALGNENASQPLASAPSPKNPTAISQKTQQKPKSSSVAGPIVL